MSEVGQRIRELRKFKKMTQQELSNGIVTRGYLSQIEKGLVHPSYDTLKSFAEKLDCNIESFYEEPQNKALILSQVKKKIKYIEGKIESGQFNEVSKSFLDFQTDMDNEDLFDVVDLGIICWIRGNLNEKEQCWNSAIENYHNSVDFFNEPKNVKYMIRSIDSLSNLYLKRGEFQEAFKFLNIAYDNLILYQVGGQLKASILINLGYCHLNFGEYHSAVRFLNEANKINKATNIYVKAGQVFLLLALCYKELSQYDNAEKSNNNALKFFIAVEDKENEATVYNNLANLYLTKHKINESIKYFLKSAQIFESINHEKGLLLSKSGLAKAYQQDQQYQGSQQICNQIINQPHNAQYRGYCYIILGEIEIEKKQFHQALNYFEKGLNIFKEANLKWGINVVIKKMANTFWLTKDFYKSASLYNTIEEKKEEKDIYPLFI